MKPTGKNKRRTRHTKGKKKREKKKGKQVMRLTVTETFQFPACCGLSF